MRNDGLLSEHGNSGGGGGRREWARPCDSCTAAASAVYCRADAAYLCAGCDARVHAANPVASRHERVWVCQACERAPAALTCRADAAALCGACDADVHSANPLARRHHRDPILPLPHGRLPAAGEAEEEDTTDEEEAASWLLLNPAGSTKAAGFLYGGEVEEYLDLVEYNSGTENQSHDQHHHHQHHQYVKAEEAETEQLVPMECLVPNSHQNHQHQQQQQQQQQQHNYGMGMDYEVSNAGLISYSSHNVSYSSVEAGIVPETHTMTDIGASKGTMDLFSDPLAQMPPQFSLVDREARVLRYREKRKMRKFEKTIRYASRKAYAETRPRIKGRFAKRSDVELEVDQMFATSVMSEGGYGIVPSF